MSKASAQAIAYHLQQFFDDFSYRLMRTSAGKSWGKGKAITIAVEIVAAACGTPLKPQQIATLTSMEETEMVQEMVTMIPEELREHFELLMQQLQMLVTTLTRVRIAADSGEEKQVQTVIEETDATSACHQILKNTVIQACKEVSKLHHLQETWGKSMEKRINRLQALAEKAESDQAQLVSLEATLASFGGDQKNKGKSLLMGLAEKNDKALLNSVVSNWRGLAIKGATERAIRKGIEDELAVIDSKILALKQRQLTNVRNTMRRLGMENDSVLLAEVVHLWKKEIELVKIEKTTQAEVEIIQSRLNVFSTNNAANAMKVMYRMAAQKDESLLALAVASWVKFVEEIRTDKELEEAVKAAEDAVKAHLAKKKAEAKSVLDRMAGGTDTGLLSLVVQNWCQTVQDEKKARELDRAMDADGSRFKAMKKLAKGKMFNVQAHADEQLNTNLMLRVIGHWQIEAKVNRVAKYYGQKMESKRKQLSSVQTLFKRFAVELDNGLGDVDGESSGRNNSRRGKTGLTRDLSLPEIRSR